MKTTRQKASLLLFFVFLLVISTVSAAPPFVTSTNNDGYEGLRIVSPQFESYSTRKDSYGHFSVFDSNNTLLDDTNTVCNISVSTQEKHLYYGSLVYNEDFRTWDTANFFGVINDTGFYQGITYCYNDVLDERGYIVNEVIFTRDGYPINISWNDIVIILISLSALFLFSSFLVKSKELESIKVLLWFMGVVNTIILGMTMFILIINTGNEDAFYPVALGYFGVLGLILMAIIWLYAINMIFPKGDKK